MSQSPIYLGLKIISKYTNRDYHYFEKQFSEIVNKYPESNAKLALAELVRIKDLSNQMGGIRLSSKEYTPSPIIPMKNLYAKDLILARQRFDQYNTKMVGCTITKNHQFIFGNLSVKAVQPKYIEHIIIFENYNKYIHFVYDKININVDTMIDFLKNTNLPRFIGQIMVAIQISNIDSNSVKIIYANFEDMKKNNFGITMVSFDNQFESIISPYYTKNPNLAINLATWKMNTLMITGLQYQIDELIIYEDINF